MNISTYLFGNFSNGYNQYPNDYTSSIFKSFRENSKAKTQIAIHRDGDLMYYGYIRTLEDNSYIGLCAVINGYYIIQIKSLFSVFEKVIEMMIRNGYFIHFDDHGEIVTSTNRLTENKEALTEINQSLINLFDHLNSKSLPPVSYDISSQAVKSYDLEDGEEEIVTSSFTVGYTLLYKSKGYDTASLLGYKGVIGRLNKQINNLKADNKSLNEDKKKLQEDLTKQKLKQRNTTLVAILAIIVIVFGIVIWNKVLYPDEVTKYDAGEYLYYGPMQNGKPNGTGVAIYPKNDINKRLYYYGNFTDGIRVDSSAIMFYRDGSYFKGSMDNDNWRKGVFYDVENEHFIGEFKNNKPYKGTWYKHEPVQTLNGDE